MWGCKNGRWPKCDKDIKNILRKSDLFDYINYIIILNDLLHLK